MARLTWPSFHSKGVQEYVEAATFYSYNLDGSVYTREQLNKQLEFDSEVRDAGPGSGRERIAGPRCK